MNPFRSRPLFFTGLIIYGLLLTAALLYFRFPAKKFKTFCQTQVEQLLPDTRCSISKIRYKFPFAMEIIDIDLSSNQENEQNLLTVDRAIIRPKVTAPKSQFQVELAACDGKHDFSLLLKQKKKEARFENIHLTNLDLAKIPFLRQTFGREITGLLSGSGTYRTSWNDDLVEGKGKGKISMVDGSFKLLLPILSLQKIDLKKFNADLVFQKEKLQFNKGRFQGRELTGNFSGGLALRSPIEQSKFSFKGTLEPLPPLLKKNRYAKNLLIQMKKRHNRSTLPFLLQGSVKRPSFKFDS
ncbi:MAG TPA: type II secretion system protein GspN [Desulfobacterales bacterium]|nr:type II secretion system protein GspN [Desulfobacterales bacterium]HIP39373.1 type II secretion system protein GspN [Desulfocapsa sulfexigens]